MSAKPQDDGYLDAAAYSDDLAQLREQFPKWRFGTVWATAATGPDRRRLWARYEEILLSAWNADSLRNAVRWELEHSADGGSADDQAHRSTP
jgi:hypothetical protein